MSNIVPVIVVEGRKTEQYLLISDIHFDNPKCDRKLLKRDLDEAISRGAKILMNGDLFCVMQGLSDKRHVKSDLMERHKGANYFDLVIEDAVEFFAPYAKNIIMAGYGNHETAVLKRQEHDILNNFCYRMRVEHGSSIQLGGYGGWVVFQLEDKGHRCSFKMKYFHGEGGGGPVTKGAIKHQRKQASVHGADIIWQAHIHELQEDTSVVEVLEASPRGGYKIKLRDVQHVRTSTYKEEYGDGTKGWHPERGAPPKPLGGYWLTVGFDILGGGKVAKYIELVKTRRYQDF
jgi:hypothetical protein